MRKSTRPANHEAGQQLRARGQHLQGAQRPRCTTHVRSCLTCCVSISGRGITAPVLLDTRTCEVGYGAHKKKRGASPRHGREGAEREDKMSEVVNWT